jgi:hypothetical protein
MASVINQSRYVVLVKRHATKTRGAAVALDLPLITRDPQIAARPGLSAFERDATS